VWVGYGLGVTGSGDRPDPDREQDVPGGGSGRGELPDVGAGAVHRGALGGASSILWTKVFLWFTRLGEAHKPIILINLSSGPKIQI
jgi:hypothetical protein